MGLNSGYTKIEPRNAAADAVEVYTKVRVIQESSSLFLFCSPWRVSVIVDPLGSKHSCEKELRDGS